MITARFILTAATVAVLNFCWAQWQKEVKSLEAAEGYQLQDPSARYSAHFDIKNEDIGANTSLSSKIPDIVQQNL